MINDILANLISSLIEKLLQAGSNESKKQYEIYKFLSTNQLLELNDSFSSIYLHSLIDFEKKCNHGGWVKAFGMPSVIDLFQKYNKNLITEEEFKSKYKKQIEFRAHLDEKLTDIYYHYLTEYNISNIIKLFIESFETTTNNAKNPIQRELFNEIRELKADKFRLEEEKRLNSFDYQIEGFLKKIINDFTENFENGDHYVAINGRVGINVLKSDIKESNKYIKTSITHKISHDNQDSQNNQRLIPIQNEVVEYRENNNIQYNPLDDYINIWLGNEDKNLLIILGEYGTGKTTFMKFVAHQLASSFLDKSLFTSIQDKFQRAPILFSLRDFELKMESFIVNQFHKNGVNIGYLDFLKKIENQELILILDGFDEMTSRMDSEEKRRNFDRIAQIAKQCPQGKNNSYL